MARSEDPPGDGPTGRPGRAREQVLAADPSCVRRARLLVRQACDDVGAGTDTCDTVVLLTSEAVTNVVRHACGPARLVVRAVPGAVRVEVGDDSPRRPRPAEGGTGDLGGRGLGIVGALARAWGVVDAPRGKTVWFEVALG